MRWMACILAAMVFVCAACAPTAPSYDAQTDALLERAIDLINADDAEALLSLFSEAVKTQEAEREAVRQGLTDLTDHIERFERVGIETTPYKANGAVMYQTYAHYELHSETARYALFLACWHTDGESSYPNSEVIGLHTLRLVEDADCPTQYDNLTAVQLDSAGFYYRPQRLYRDRTSYAGAFRVTDEDGTTWLTNEHIHAAVALWQTDGTGASFPAVQITLTADGADAFAEATRRNLYKTLPMYIGDVCVAEPVVQAEITDGLIMLSGQDLLPSYDAALDLETYFNTYAG